MQYRDIPKMCNNIPQTRTSKSTCNAQLTPNCLTTPPRPINIPSHCFDPNIEHIFHIEVIDHGLGHKAEKLVSYFIRSNTQKTT